MAFKPIRTALVYLEVLLGHALACPEETSFCHRVSRPAVCNGRGYGPLYQPVARISFMTHMSKALYLELQEEGMCAGSI